MRMRMRIRTFYRCSKALCHMIRPIQSYGYNNDSYLDDYVRYLKGENTHSRAHYVKSIFSTRKPIRIIFTSSRGKMAKRLMKEIRSLRTKLPEITRGQAKLLESDSDEITSVLVRLTPASGYYKGDVIDFKVDYYYYYYYYYRSAASFRNRGYRSFGQRSSCPDCAYAKLQ